MTMGVEFRISRNDQKPIEDFLGRRSDGVTAVSLDTKAGSTQFNVARAAREADVAVYWEPGSERLQASATTTTSIPRGEVSRSTPRPSPRHPTKATAWSRPPSPLTPKLSPM